MRYAIVNDRSPRNGGLPVICPLCPTILEKGYTRDLDTRICYCGPHCLEEHIFQSTHAIEHAARMIS